MGVRPQSQLRAEQQARLAAEAAAAKAAEEEARRAAEAAAKAKQITKGDTLLHLVVETTRPLLAAPQFGSELGGVSDAHTCLRGQALHGALKDSSGFGHGGRKSGLRANSTGAWLRLSLRLPPQSASVWAHLGYLRSWRRRFLGAARVACEPPCVCPSSVLEGFDRREKASVTALEALLVRGEPGATCWLHLRVIRGEGNGTAFVLRQLIAGSTDQSYGPIMEAFASGGQSLLH